MNKQELIDKLKRRLTVISTVEGSDYDKGYKHATKQHLAMIAKLDEPVRPPEPKQLELKKPVVPQYVADWYEKNKDGLEWNLYTICVDFYKRELQDDLHNWFRYSDNKPIETLVKMKLFGYEVEKDKLYLASFRDTYQYLGWNEKLGEWFMSSSPFTSGVEQTQETWEGVGIWNNPAFEIKEVEE